MNSDCDRFEKLISMYLDNEISENEKVALEKHINICGICREKLKLWQDNDALMKKEFSAMDVSNDFYSKVLRSIEVLELENYRENVRRGLASRFWQFIYRYRIVVAVASCLLLAVLVSRYIMMNSSVSMTNFSHVQVKEPSLEMAKTTAVKKSVDESEKEVSKSKDSILAEGKVVESEVSDFSGMEARKEISNENERVVFNVIYTTYEISEDIQKSILSNMKVSSQNIVLDATSDRDILATVDLGDASNSQVFSGAEEKRITSNFERGGLGGRAKENKLLLEAVQEEQRKRAVQAFPKGPLSLPVTKQSSGKDNLQNVRQQAMNKNLVVNREIFNRNINAYILINPKNVISMPVIEVGIPPFSEVIQSSLDNLVKNKVIKKYEQKSSHIVLYLDNIDKPMNFTIKFRYGGSIPVPESNIYERIPKK